MYLCVILNCPKVLPSPFIFHPAFKHDLVVWARCGAGMMKDLLFVFGFDISPDPDFDLLQRNVLPGGFESLLDRPYQSETARNFHKGKGDAPDRVRPEDLGQFLGVELNIIKLGTAYNHCFSFQKIVVKIGVCEWNAVGCYQKVGILEIGRVDRDQLQLNRPVGKHRNRGLMRACFVFRFNHFKVHCPR